MGSPTSSRILWIADHRLYKIILLLSNLNKQIPFQVHCIRLWLTVIFYEIIGFWDGRTITIPLNRRDFCACSDNRKYFRSLRTWKLHVTLSRAPYSKQRAAVHWKDPRFPSHLLTVRTNMDKKQNLSWSRDVHRGICFSIYFSMTHKTWALLRPL